MHKPRDQDASRVRGRENQKLQERDYARRQARLTEHVRQEIARGRTPHMIAQRLAGDPEWAEYLRLADQGHDLYGLVLKLLGRPPAAGSPGLKDSPKILASDRKKG